LHFPRPFFCSCAGKSVANACRTSMLAFSGVGRGAVIVTELARRLGVSRAGVRDRTRCEIGAYTHLLADRVIGRARGHAKLR